MPHVNILKQVKVGEPWKVVSIPHDHHGRCDLKALPEGRSFIEWWVRGKRKLQAAGAARRRIVQLFPGYYTKTRVPAPPAMSAEPQHVYR